VDVTAFHKEAIGSSVEFTSLCAKV